ncbi:MAG TPA: hypothetical protein VHV51_22745, partial [Polyangiaceae bacterium]|nr:hypothetical protein [Polyangiaceae bacterium]
FFSRAARAETLQTAIGSKAIPLGEARVACAAPGGGWTIEPSSQLHAVRPPDSTDAVGTVVELKVAPNLAACSTGATTIKLVATARPPSIDPGGVTLLPDQGKADVRGHRLTGVALAWRSNTASGVDVCESPKIENGTEHCSFNVGRGLPADPNSGSLSLIAAGGHAGSDVVDYDAEGKLVPPTSLVLAPSRVVLSGVISPDASIDLSTGRGEVELTHPDAVAGVDCGAQRCEIFHNALVVRSLSSNVSSVDVKFRLVPGVFVAKGASFDATPIAHLAVVHCPMSVPSGPVLRNTSSARMVLRIEGRCANEVPSLRFLIGSDSVEVLESLVDSTGTDVLVQVGSTDAQALTVTAVHNDDPGVAVAVARVETLSPPQSSASLEIPGHKNLSFVPTNRPAIVHVPPLEHHAHLVPLPVPGVYSVQKQGADYTVTGDPDAAGLAALRFGYRNDALPGDLAGVDLGVLTSPLQRNIHEANLPAPIGGSALGPHPIVEFVCTTSDNVTERIMPGITAHLPFEARDNCRLIFHRDRLPASYGTQKLNLEVDVVDSDGGSRAEGHVSETIVMRVGGDPIYAWIQGVKAPFDRVLVRISHAADEAHYVGGAEIQAGAPEVKWTVVLGTGHARLYATTAIPTGLYRFGDAAHSGLLSLNFGIVSRLTWLSADGHEGFLGLEGGIMAIGLSDDKSNTGNSLTQVGMVAGIGLSVPIANRSTPTQASINLHGWFEEDISHNSADAGSRSAFIFGPSISIGNVGTNL